MTPGYGYGYGYGLGVPKAPSWDPLFLGSDLAAWWRPEELVNPNQLRYSDDLDNGVWIGPGVTVTTGQSDPDGGNNAVKLSSDGSLRAFGQAALTFQAGVDETAQVWARWGARGMNAGFLRIDDGIGTTDQATADATWTPYTVTRTLDAAATKSEWIFILPANTDWIVYHPQLEVGPDASAYRSNLGTPEGLINEWLDVSGNLEHITQVTSSLMPLADIDFINGFSAARHDDIDDYLAVGTALNYGTGAFDAWHVLQLPADNNAYNRGVSGSERIWIRGGGRLDFQTTTGLVTLTDPGQFTGGVPYLIRIARDSSGNVMCEKNGVDITIGSPNNAGQFGVLRPFTYDGTSTSQYGMESFQATAKMSDGHRAGALGYFDKRYPDLGI